MSDITPFLNRILHGDCIEVLPTLPANSVGLILTDPPYIAGYRSRDGRTHANETNHRWLQPAFAAMYRVLQPDSFCVSFYGWHKVDRFMMAWRAAGFTPVSHLVWVKDYASRKGFTRSHHECAYLLAKGKTGPAQARAPRCAGLDLHRQPAASDPETSDGPHPADSGLLPAR